MTITETFLQELKEEAATTRKMLACIPDGQYSWQPHPKSMTIKRLATHIAELPSWIGMAIHTSELDFENNPYQVEDINDTAALLDYFERNYAEGVNQLEQVQDDQLQAIWTLRNGQTILSKRPKKEVIRMAYSQIIHHRAQLGVFLRLLDVPIPGSYGPSADEQ